MPKNCIFCNSLLDGSDEHIIPDSINGQLHTKELICKACNNKFGIKLDPIIKETLSTVLYVLGIGNVKTLKIEDDNGTAYLIDKIGKIKQIEPDVKTFTIDSKVGISVSGEKNIVPKIFAKKLVRTFGNDALKMMNNASFEYSEKSLITKELKAETKLNVTPKLLLALDKIITEFYAFSGLDTAVIRERLDKIYNLDESNPLVIIGNFDQKVRVPKDDEVSHLIIIRSDCVKKQVYAYIELFNVICGYSVLIDNYSGSEINKVFHQNALTGEFLTSNINLSIDQFENENENSKSDYLANNLFERKRNIDFLEMVDEMCLSVREDLDKKLAAGMITEDEHVEKYLDITAKAVAEMMVFGFPDDVEDFTEDEQKQLNYIHSVIKEDHKEEFEFYYHQLIGQNYRFDDDDVLYLLENFTYAKHSPKNNQNRLKVYVHFKSLTKKREKDIICYEIFSAMRIPPPLDSNWL